MLRPMMAPHSGPRLRQPQAKRWEQDFFPGCPAKPVCRPCAGSPRRVFPGSGGQAWPGCDGVDFPTQKAQYSV